MRRALAEASRGRGSVEPNPMVGAVVVSGGEAVGVGHHERFGGPHAEVVALARAGDQARGARRSTSPSNPAATTGRPPLASTAVLRSRDGPGGRRAPRSVPQGRRRWPEPTQGERGRGDGRGRSRRRPIAQRPLPQAAGARPAVRHGEVGDDARRADRHRDRATADGSPTPGRGPWSTKSGGGWTPSSSESGPPWPTTPN